MAPVLASVRDLRRMRELIEIERPDVILHAAALKHVRMCEENPLEALTTNAWASCRLAELARELRVPNFTLVSTDKAVAPACVMGASKRFAETYVRSLAPSPHTRFAAVRFGNVLGSNGSVLPLFHEQIARGGPVTVTDPRATRFFMTIPEACGLILQATRIAQGGEVYVLEMGEPVRVLDMAHNLIRLYGFEPGRDIEVKIIGLRPGEKLHETLVDEAETAEPLETAKLLRIRSAAADGGRCRDLLAALELGLRAPRPGGGAADRAGDGADLPDGIGDGAPRGDARVSVLAIVPARSGSKSAPRQERRVVPRTAAARPQRRARPARAQRRPGPGQHGQPALPRAGARGGGGGALPAAGRARRRTCRPTSRSSAHALAWLEADEGYRPDLLVHLRPTAPTRRVSDVENAVDLLLSRPDADSVRSVVEAPHTPYKMWRAGERRHPAPAARGPVARVLQPAAAAPAAPSTCRTRASTWCARGSCSSRPR